jgi:hypothetical protein
MKTLMIAAATAATLAGASAASANGLAFFGGIEYATDAKVIETTAGVEYGFGAFTVSPLLTLNDVAGDLSLRAVEITAGYALNTNINLYLTVEGDNSFNRTETTLGVAFRF